MSVRELIDYLSDAYVSYELDIRQVNFSRLTLGAKKIKLFEILEEEDNDLDSDPLMLSCLEPDIDLRECRDLFNELRDMFMSDRIYNASLIDACIKFLYPRVVRVNTTIDIELKSIQDLLIDDICRLRYDITRISVPLPSNQSGNRPRSSNTNNEQNPHSDPIHRSPSVVSLPVDRTNANQSRNFNNNYVPVWKWEIKFSGDEEKSSATEFLQIVDDYSKSRNVSERELLNSISDLLIGSARKWFRATSVNQPFQSWFDFSTRFLEDFEPVYDSDRLLDSIKRRFQQSDETVVKYFICMEDLFLRLPYKIVEQQRVKIIYKNLLPRYVKGLAMWTFHTINDLKTACRNIEAAEVTIKSRPDNRVLNTTNNRYNSTAFRNVPTQNWSQNRPTQSYQPTTVSSSQNLTYNTRSNQNRLYSYPQRSQSQSFQRPTQQRQIIPSNQLVNTNENIQQSNQPRTNGNRSQNLPSNSQPSNSSQNQINFLQSQSTPVQGYSYMPTHFQDENQGAASEEVLNGCQINSTEFMQQSENFQGTAAHGSTMVPPE